MEIIKITTATPRDRFDEARRVFLSEWRHIVGEISEDEAVEEATATTSAMLQILIVVGK